MNKIEPERIENNRFEKNKKRFKILAIMSLILAIIRIITTPETLSNIGKILDFSILLFPVYFFYEYKRKSKNWNGQFIEWGENEITYKTREKENTIILYESISMIRINLDEIIIISNEKEFKIQIEDFTDYKDRIRIKKKIEKMKSEIF